MILLVVKELEGDKALGLELNEPVPTVLILSAFGAHTPHRFVLSPKAHSGGEKASTH